MAVIGLLLIGVGVFYLLRPDIVWTMTERWKSHRADEPSDLYAIMIRIGGAIVLLGGIALIILRALA